MRRRRQTLTKGLRRTWAKNVWEADEGEGSAAAAAAAAASDRCSPTSPSTPRAACPPPSARSTARRLDLGLSRPVAVYVAAANDAARASLLDALGAGLAGSGLAAHSFQKHILEGYCR